MLDQQNYEGVVECSLTQTGVAWQTMLGAWDKNVGAGGHMSSKLAQRVAVNGLCTSYMAFNTNYHDTGLFGVYAVADKHQPVGVHLCLQYHTNPAAQMCQEASP